MDKQITFNGLEDILRTAIKLSDFAIKDLASAAQMSKSGIYCFTSKQNHISVEKGDALIKYIQEKDPQALKLATDLYLNY